MNLGRGGSIVGGESLRDGLVIYSTVCDQRDGFTGDALELRTPHGVIRGRSGFQ